MNFRLLVDSGLRLAVRTRSALLYRWRFERFGRKSVLRKPTLLSGCKGISIGERVEIRAGARLETINHRRGDAPKLLIGDGTSIHLFFHCGAAERVEIGANVLIAGRVYITDHDHDPGRPGEPPCTNGRLITAPTIIEDDCWLGEGAVVLKGIRLGRGAAVAANAVVTRSVPPYTIVAGVPARPIRRWDPDRESWVALGQQDEPV